jgi:hypothetical protein
MDISLLKNFKTISRTTRTSENRDLTFLLTGGTKETGIDLLIINLKMAFLALSPKVETETDSQDIQNQETKVKIPFKTIHGDSN